MAQPGVAELHRAELQLVTLGTQSCARQSEDDDVVVLPLSHHLMRTGWPPCLRCSRR